MNNPSVKRMMEVLKIDRLTAKKIRAVMDGQRRVDGETRLERIDTLLSNCGVEFIPAGHNAKSPAIHYSNTGDSYGVTVLKLNGGFKLGSWGSIVELGNYD